MITKRTQRVAKVGPQGGTYITFHGIRIYMKPDSDTTQFIPISHFMEAQ